MKKTIIALAAVLSFGVVAAIAQVATPKVVSVGTADLIPVVPNGQPSARTSYATAAAINGVQGYVDGGAVATAFTYTFTNTQTNYIIRPAGTLATGTLTAAPNPGDGQRECFLSTQTQTALTWNANTGQSISNAPTAGVANTAVCMVWEAAANTWYRSP